jgi:sialic acid synthase SpsE
VVEAYRDAAVPWSWTPFLKDACDRYGVEFMSTPYSLEAVTHLDPFVKRWKIGSGDITYRDLLTAVARTGKPVLLATGASTQDEVLDALTMCRDAGNYAVGVMQCNTDYSGHGIAFTNLRWLRTYEVNSLTGMLQPWGLSDHTKSLPVVLGAVALGASVIERHFTDDNARPGPDHGFAMTPGEWRAMVDAVRELESAMGDGIKKVEPNEIEARVVQRRCWRAARDLPAGHTIARGDVVALRPCPEGAVTPMFDITGRVLATPTTKGEALMQVNA